MKLYVDDVRTPPAGWPVVRSVREAVRFLQENDVEEVSLDYMIGDSFDNNFAPVAEFIASMPEERRPRRVRIHTASSEGARHLKRILEGHVQEIVRP